LEVSEKYTSPKKQLPAEVDAPTVYDRSPLLNGHYSPDFFGLDANGESACRLFEEVVAYLKIANENVGHCLEGLSAGARQAFEHGAMPRR